MPLCRVTLTANAGVMIDCGGAKVFCDALHRTKTKNFSTVDEARQRHMVTSPEFKGADAMIFTHKHHDHYSHFLISQALKLTPGIKLISPVDEFEGQFLLCEKEHRLSFPCFTADFMKLCHAGEEYTDLPNYGYLLDFGGFTVLGVGDCRLCEPDLAEWIDGRRVDLAFFNFPWLTLRRGREFIKEFIKPRHLMFYHIPFANDNISGYREASFKSLPLMDKPDDVRLLCEPFQTEDIF